MSAIAEKCIPSIFEMARVALGLFVASVILGVMFF